MRLGIVSDDEQPGVMAGRGQVSGAVRLGFQGAMMQVSLSGLARGHGGIANQPLSRWAFKLYRHNYLAIKSALK